jgi:hypothetical protein
MLSPLLKDATLKVTKALPTGAAATTTSAIDTGTNTTGTQPKEVELLLTVPSLTLAQLPNTKTMTYDIIMSANSDMSSPTIIFPGVLVQTGVTGTDPTVGNTFRTRLPSNGARYWGALATGVATGDGSASSMTLEMVF